MLRQGLIYLIASSLVVIFAKYAQVVVVYINMMYTYLNVILAPLFRFIGLNGMVQKILLLVLIPAIIAGIPAVIYRLIKKKEMPHFFALTWCLWLIIVLSYILVR